MAGIIPTTLDDVPDSASYNVGRPLFGRTVSSLSNGVNHLAGFRGLRFMQSQVMVAPDALDPLQTITNDTAPVGLMTNDPIMRWVVSPLAQFIHWGAWVAANGSGTAPRVQVFLETVAGVNIDGPIEWTLDNGRLPNNFYGAPLVLFENERGASAGRDTLLHTGWRTGVSNAPRLLDVSAHRGLDVQIRVVASDVRIYSHFVLEAYESGL